MIALACVVHVDVGWLGFLVLEAKIAGAIVAIAMRIAGANVESSESVANEIDLTCITTTMDGAARGRGYS